MSRKQACAGTITSRKYGRYGERCNRFAVNGSDMCAVHGGTTKGGLSDPVSFKTRCNGTNRQGEPCRNPAIAGGTVCRSHGGASPQVKKKARERLLELVEPAVVQLNRVLTAPGTSDSDRLRAIQMVLDRAGMGPGMVIEHEVKPYEVVMSHVIKSLPEGFEPPSHWPALDPANIEDAELVEDEGEADEPRPRDALPQIIPPREYGEKATIRIGSPLDRVRRTHAEDPDD